MGRSDINEQLGRNLVRLRLQAGLAQAFIAERAGMNQQTYSKYESGRLRLRVDMIDRLASALECSPRDILAPLSAFVSEPAKPTGIAKRPGHPFNLVGTVPEGVKVVSMLTYQDQLLLATENAVYRKVGDAFEPVPIKLAPSDAAAKEE